LYVSSATVIDLVIVRQAVDFSGGEIDKNVMIKLNTMLICRSGYRLTLEIATTDKTGVYVVIR
jgi:hypothetical protein